MQGRFLAPRRSASRFVAGAVLVLAACGGGGGDGAPPLPAATVDVTAANRDDVAHAAIAAVVALSPIGQVPTAGSAGQPPGSLARALAARVPAAPSARIAAAGGGFSRAAAISGSTVDACPQGGTVTTTFEDRDGSASVSAGDVLTLDYAGCMYTAFVSLDGTVSTTYLWISEDRASFSAHTSMLQYAQTSARHALTVNGSMRLDLALDRLTITADGPVVASVATHVYADTVTLMSGFSESAVIDAAGDVTSTVSGSIDSAAIGGIVQVSATGSAALVQSPVEEYPHTGRLWTDGRRGTLLTTALSSAAVQFDLDADGDGYFESTATATWDWLL